MIMCSENIVYSQTTEQQAIGISLMLGSKVVIVEEAHSEYSIVDTDTHVGNCQTGYDLPRIITRIKI